jgi:hypothetical protein
LVSLGKRIKRQSISANLARANVRNKVLLNKCRDGHTIRKKELALFEKCEVAPFARRSDAAKVIDIVA